MDINNDAEKALIGCLFKAPEMLSDIITTLPSEAFNADAYKEAYKAICNAYMNKEAIDLVTITNAVDDIYKHEIAEAAADMFDIVNTANIKRYADIINQNAKRRSIKTKTAELYEMIDNEEITVCQDKASEICRCFDDNTKQFVYTPEDTVLLFHNTQTQKKEYIKTGFETVDNMLYIDKGSYIIVGGRPSAGKTALTLQMFLNMAKKHKVLYFSLETSAERLSNRIISRLGAIPLSDIIKRELTNEQWEKVAAVSSYLQQLQYEIVEASGWTLSQIQSTAVSKQAEVIFVDYIGLITAQAKTMYERATAISNGLHIMAQRNKIAVIALSQLNRATENENKEPTSASLRDSGALEQDADAILLLYGKPNTQIKDSIKRRINDGELSEDEATAEYNRIIASLPSQDRILNITKNKDGCTGIVDLKFTGQYQIFEEV